jgi:cytidylate kinase
LPKPSTIAIDGPVASGKTAVGGLLALRLAYRFIDTGVMYRAVTWAALRDGVSHEDETEVTALANRIQIEVAYSDTLGGPRIMVDGREVGGELRSRDVDGWVSLVSSYSGVRRAMVARQRDMAREGRIVMVGRDIGTVVLPDADLKVFLTASSEERARRRYSEMEERGQSPQLEQVMENLLARDDMDSSRADSPLRPGDDAYMLNTNNMGLNEVVDNLIQLMDER